jgi:sugar phosphate isomerase/epimerase
VAPRYDPEPHGGSAGRRPIGAATYTYLYSHTLDRALESLASLGMELVELTAAWPHVEDCTFDSSRAQSTRQHMERLGLVPTSFNPTYLDLNIASSSPGMRRETLRQLVAALRSCHELEVPLLVLFPGRRHVLAPAPMDSVRSVFVDQLLKLLEAAQTLGVTIGLENGPTLFLEQGVDIASICGELDHPCLRTVFDVANSFMVEDPSVGLAAALPHLALVHVSDTTRSRWEHAPVGRGKVPFTEIAAVLEAADYRGPTIMEIIDLDDPVEGLSSSAAALEQLGWARHAG